MKIAIAGTGYVGLANAVLLSQKNQVVTVDLVQEKVDRINARKSPLADREIEEYLATKPLQLTATTDGEAAYRGADYVIISTPTNYDPVKNYFDTSSVEAVIRQVMAVNPNAVMVIKSTSPRNFCGRGGRCMTISIPPGSSWARPRRTSPWWRRQRPLRSCCGRGR